MSFAVSDASELKRTLIKVLEEKQEKNKKNFSMDDHFNAESFTDATEVTAVDR